jgi:hypothetical protein
MVVAVVAAMVVAVVAAMVVAVVAATGTEVAAGGRDDRRRSRSTSWSL